MEGIGANRVEDVLALTVSELASLRNFGDTSFAQLKKILRDAGFDIPSEWSVSKLK